MFPLHKENLKILRHNWVCYWRPPLKSIDDMKTAKTPLKYFCLSNSSVGVRFFSNALDQPIDDVAKYFGEKVAFYFAWLEMYTRWLVFPTIVGIFLFIAQIRSKSLDQPMAPFYALFMAVWASAFLVAWRRKANSLAYKWGVLGYEDEEVLRAEFKADPTVSTDTIKRYPSWKRFLKYFVTLPVVVLFIVLVLVIMYYAFTTRYLQLLYAT